MYLAKIRASNPRLYGSENQLQQELITHMIGNPKFIAHLKTEGPRLRGLGHVELANQLEDALNRNELHRLPQILKEGYVLPGKFVDEAGTSLLEGMLKRGEDAIIYGNMGEGWRGAPSVISPFQEQIQIMKEIPYIRKGYLPHLAERPSYLDAPVSKESASLWFSSEQTRQQKINLTERLKELQEMFK